MNKITKYATGLLAGVIMYGSAVAQDFYNGCRGPRSLQMDTYITQAGNITSLTEIPKIFTNNLDKSLPNMVLAAPLSMSEKKKPENKGVNLGYIVEGEYGSAIFAAGLFKDNNEKYSVINPQIYFTHESNKTTLDLETNLPINTTNGQISGSVSMTVGYGISDMVRMGVSATKSKDIDFKLITRVELTKDHQYWTEVYIGKNDLGFRLASNF